MGSTSLVNEAWAALGPPPAAFLKIARGVTWAQHGVHSLCIPETLRSLASLQHSSSTWVGPALLHAGLTLRCAGAWARAADLHWEAAEALRRQAMLTDASVALLLATEAVCATQGAEAAGKRLENTMLLARGESKRVADAARAWVALWRGRYDEAEEILTPLAQSSSLQTLAGRWLQCLRLECCIERDTVSFAEVRALAEALMDLGCGGEVVARALVNAVHSGLRQARGALGRDRDSLLAVVRRLSRYARTYALGMPRYQAWLDAFASIMKRACDAAGEQRCYTRAVAALQRLNLAPEEARMLEAYSALRQGGGADSYQEALQRALETYQQTGAQARGQALENRQRRPRQSMRRASLPSGVRTRSTAGLQLHDDVELNAVFELMRMLSSIHDMNDLLQGILDKVVALLKAARGVLLVVQDDGALLCAATHNVDVARVREDSDEISFSVVRECQRSNKAVLADNAQIDERFRGKQSIMATNIRSVLCGPLNTTNKQHGFIYLDSLINTRIFNEHSLDLLHVFCTQAAVALENASAFEEINTLNRSLERKVEERTAQLSQVNIELVQAMDTLRNTELRLAEAERDALNQEIAVARGIQDAIVPREDLYTLPGLHITGCLIPATVCAGDFWTFAELRHDKTMLMVADVTGHGVGSAMLTAVARAVIALTLRRGQVVEPHTLLSDISDVIFDTAKGQLLMTAAVCVCCRRTRTLTYASAGHIPSYLMTPGQGPRAATALHQVGQRLGDGAGAQFTSQSWPYKVGDKLVMFTDGLTECTNAQDQQYGDSRLRRSLARHSEAPLSAMMHSVLADAAEFFGAHMREDDITLVVAELL